jgi:hypothetical protein
LHTRILTARADTADSQSFSELVSERTAERMVAALLHKLDVTNRIAAAAMAGRFGLLDDPTETD